MIPWLWTKFLLFLAGVTLLAWLALVLREKDIRPARDLAVFFRRLSKPGRIVFGTFFVAMWILASVKPGDGGGNGEGGEGNGRANLVQTVIRPGQGELPQTQFPGFATNIALRGELEEASFRSGELLGMTSSMSDEDFRRGFVLTRVGTDEAFPFAPPPGAAVCADWRAFGAAEDWICLAFEDWAFNLGTNDVD